MTMVKISSDLWVNPEHVESVHEVDSADLVGGVTSLGYVSITTTSKSVWRIAGQTAEEIVAKLNGIINPGDLQ